MPYGTLTFWSVKSIKWTIEKTISNFLIFYWSKKTPFQDFYITSQINYLHETFDLYKYFNRQCFKELIFLDPRWVTFKEKYETAHISSSRSSYSKFVNSEQLLNKILFLIGQLLSETNNYMCQSCFQGDLKFEFTN